MYNVSKFGKHPNGNHCTWNVLQEGLEKEKGTWRYATNFKKDVIFSDGECTIGNDNFSESFDRVVSLSWSTINTMEPFYESEE